MEIPSVREGVGDLRVDTREEEAVAKHVDEVGTEDAVGVVEDMDTVVDGVSEDSGMVASLQEVVGLHSEPLGENGEGLGGM